MGWRQMKDAPHGKDVIILDNHDFVYRAKHTKKPVEGWVIRGHRLATFVDDELQGWMEFPAA